MHIVHSVPELSTASGGPSYTVASLCDALVLQPGLSVSVVTEPCGAAHQCQTSPQVRRVEFGGGGWSDRVLSSSYGHGLDDFLEACPADAIHVHGIWHPVFHQAVRAGKRRGAKVLIQAHGMLEPWSLSHQRAKKWLAWRLYQRHDLDLADVLMATSEDELLNLRRLGLRQPVALLPNGVHLPDAAALAVARHDAEQGAQAGGRHMLFLSRLHPKKGIEALLEAWAEVRPEGWLLSIAGAGDAAYAAGLEARARALHLGSEIRFVGELLGDAKLAAYAQADLFVLPTFSENFGVVVAEALACGVPVITTRGAPWHSLETHRCGWWIDTGVPPLVQALRQATALDAVTLQAMGERARVLASTFDWEQIAVAAAEVYRWMSDRGPRPACVSLERD